MKNFDFKFNLIPNLIYSVTFSSIICSPNIDGIMPANYAFVGINYFFTIFVILFLFLSSLKIYKLKITECFSYVILLFILFDFLRIKYQIFAFTHLPIYVYLLFFLFPISLIFFSRNFLIKHFVNISGFLGRFSFCLVVIFSPYFLIFSYKNLMFLYNDFEFKKKIVLINKNKYTLKKNVIILFDELDNKILNLEMDSLPSFKKLLENSIKYENIVVPGTETIDVVPNLISMNSYPLYTGEHAHLKFKNKNYYKNFFEQVKIDKNNLFSLLNNGEKNELFVVGFYHKFCKLFEGSYGDCYEQKYIKKPFYRNVFENSEILDTHVKHLDSYYSLANYFFKNKNLKSAFFHLRLPHGPFIYDYKKNRYDFLNDGEQGYLGNLILADKYLGFLLDNQKKLRFNLIVFSDHGFREKYKNIENIELIDYKNRNGRSVLIYSNPNKKNNKKVYENKKLVDAFKDILIEYKDN